MIGPRRESPQRGLGRLLFLLAAAALLLGPLLARLVGG